MKTLIALYRGETVAAARLVAVSADPEIVAVVSSALLSSKGNGRDSEAADPVIVHLDAARRRALRRIRSEARDASVGRERPLVRAESAPAAAQKESHRPP